MKLNEMGFDKKIKLLGFDSFVPQGNTNILYKENKLDQKVLLIKF